MLSKPIPKWILCGAAVLAGVAGCVNAVGFSGIHHQALSHMSGTAAIFSAEVMRGHFDLAQHALTVLGCFFLGCVLSGVLIPQRTLQLGPHYGIALACEAALLVAATCLLRNGSDSGDWLAAMACGLQNALASTYSGTLLRTTHITGIITDLGIAAGQVALRKKVDRRRTGLHLILVGGFILGGFTGAWGFAHFGFDTLLLPAAVIGGAALLYPLIRRRHRPQAN